VGILLVLAFQIDYYIQVKYQNNNLNGSTYAINTPPRQKSSYIYSFDWFCTFIYKKLYLSKVNLFCLRYDIVRVVPLGLKLLMYKIHQYFYFHH